MPGGSFKTGILGYALIALDVIQFIGQILQEKGIPTTLNGWIVTLSGAAGGIGLILAKDFDKSNAPVPTPTATTVPPVK